MGLGETIVPWSVRYADEFYQLDIKKQAERGGLSREDFWFRKGNKFYRTGFYDSRNARLQNFSVLEFGQDFTLSRRTDAKSVPW